MLSVSGCASDSTKPVVATYGSFTMLPASCASRGTVRAKETYAKNAPEASLPGEVLQQRVIAKCEQAAVSAGANTLLSNGVSHFHGRNSFGYECEGEAYEC